MKTRLFFGLLSAFIAITGCSNRPKNTIDIQTQSIKRERLQAYSLNQSLLPKPFPVRPLTTESNHTALLAILENLGESSMSEQEFRQLLAEVETVINRFKTSRKKWFQQALSRGEKYLPMIHAIFVNSKIPVEMAWLALIESGFSYDIQSHAGARGMWQFMPQTAREYGLKVSRRLDQRTDPYLATRAARDYLLDRVAVYGSNSFLLVSASYNAGEGSVSRALRKLEDPFAQRNFIALRNYLPDETRHYVPQLLAAAIIGRDPARHGFQTDEGKAFAYIQLKQRISLSRLAKQTGLSKQQLRQLNPELRHQRKTPVNNFMLRIPRERSSRLLALHITRQWLPRSVKASLQMARLSNDVQIISDHSDSLLLTKPLITTNTAARPVQNKQKPASPLKTVKPRIKKVPVDNVNSKKTLAIAKPKGLYINYRVQPGNRLHDIAQWFNTPVAKIKTWNPGIPLSGRLKTGQVVKVYGLPRSWRKNRHKIRSGESLSQLALRYHVSQKRIKAWNGLKNNRLYRGQTLVIYHQSDTKQVKHHPAKILYRVKAGNYLAGVAALFNVSISHLKAWNGLRSGQINAGQRLIVYVSKSVKKKYYTIKKGDTFSEITQKLKLQPQDLRFMNGLRNIGQLKAGKKLVYFTV